jgi:hypothetical protein
VALLANNLYQHALLAPAVEFVVEIVFSRHKVRLAIDYGNDGSRPMICRLS